MPLSSTRRTATRIADGSATAPSRDVAHRRGQPAFTPHAEPAASTAQSVCGFSTCLQRPTSACPRLRLGCRPRTGTLLAIVNGQGDLPKGHCPASHALANRAALAGKCARAEERRGKCGHVGFERDHRSGGIRAYRAFARERDRACTQTQRPPAGARSGDTDWPTAAARTRMFRPRGSCATVLAWPAQNGDNCSGSIRCRSWRHPRTG